MHQFLYMEKFNGEFFHIYVRKGDKEEMGYIEIDGIYEKTVRRNEQNGYTYFTIVPSCTVTCRNQYGSVSCFGYIPPFAPGTPVKIIGNIVESKKHYYVSIEEMKENYCHRKAMITYLQSEYFPGIGEKTAENIVDEFGNDLEVIVESKNGIEVIMSKKIPHLTREKAELLIHHIKQTKSIREVYNFFTQLDVGHVYASRLINMFGIQGLEKLKKNPYKIGHKIKLPFHVCDYLAYSNHTIPFEMTRIKAIMFDVLYTNENNGNTKILYDNFLNRIQYIAKHSIYKMEIPLSCIEIAIEKTKEIYKDQHDEIYLRRTWEAEKNIAFQLKRLQVSQKVLFQREVKPVYDCQSCSFHLSESQLISLNSIKTSGIKLIIGGPGTGKTTTIKQIINLYAKQYPNHKVKLAAPTGRAAQRINETTDMPTGTVHKLLDYKIINGVKSCKTNLDPIDADLIIIDESGMLDTFLFSDLLSAIKSGATLLLYGDEDQLEAVGTGSILHDLIASNFFEIYRLKTSFRQENNNPIFKNIKKIKQGDTALVLDDNFQVYDIQENQDFERVLQNNIADVTENQAQIITMTRKNERGSVAINHLFQENIMCQEEKSLEFGKNKFHVNDKIIMNHTNYELGYYNGDIGVVKEIREHSMTVTLQNVDIDLQVDYIEDVELSYAITIFKAQGSEYDNGIIVIPSNPKWMLNRNLIFTAVSRFKKTVKIYQQCGSLFTAIENIYKMKRLTGLNYQIQRYMKGVSWT